MEVKNESPRRRAYLHVVGIQIGQRVPAVGEGVGEAQGRREEARRRRRGRRGRRALTLRVHAEALACEKKKS